MDLGKKILELRKKENLSQEQLAEKMNVTRQTISNGLCGIRRNVYEGKVTVSFVFKDKCRVSKV